MQRRRFLVGTASALGGAAAGAALGFNAGIINQAITGSEGSVKKAVTLGTIAGGAAAYKFFLDKIRPRIVTPSKDMVMALLEKFEEVKELVDFLQQYSTMDVSGFEEGELVTILNTAIGIIKLQDRIRDLQKN